MVKLRLRRMGAINQPFYRIVAVDSRKKRDGKYIECIGWYDPKPDPSKIKIDTERALYWLGVGAQPSDTVRSLLRKAGVLQIWHNSKQNKNQKTAEAE
ncbi:MAG: 30S ribosomal protein S16 [Candidatus Cloacimonetes bacterium ADurb.Bin003]|nr:MAG: 30S ribosomal protein S16 [Candidatus Cloacimonetes bacterium ADurb.Bin003]